VGDLRDKNVTKFYRLLSQRISGAEGKATGYLQTLSLTTECNNTGPSGIKVGISPCINMPDQTSPGNAVDVGVDTKISMAVDVE
jgi:hypothetical protein